MRIGPFSVASVRRRRALAALALGLSLAGSPVAARAAETLSHGEVLHLGARTGHLAIPEGFDALQRRSREQAVDLLLDGLRQRPFLPPPAWVDELPETLTGKTDAERQAYFARRSAQQRELQSWWYLEMLATPSPLTERLVFFWHNHFTSSLSKVNSAQMMYRQQALFRQAGTSDFGALLAGIVRDPAMLIYLDNNRNVARAPNENLARELMELFTLGIGHYGEQDVKEVARALTGYTVDGATESFRFDQRNHDSGQKTILGQTGRFTGDDVARILLNHPKTAELVVTKLWREFVSARPDPAEVRRLAEIFREGRFRMRPLLRALFLSDAFWSPANRAGLIKAPHEFLVHTVRHLGLPIRESLNLPSQGRAMGLDLLNPPTVKGWPGHFAWIGTTSLPARQRFVQTAVSIWRAEVAPGLFGVPANRLPRIDARQLDMLNAAYLTVGPAYVQPAAPLELSAALRAVLLDAGYQTK
ncbi:MAG TPA: DUF1800 domain-containing protein [Azospirillaceae bacterium]|nr:DUF1800 domain-containing protein [Azospirillaceae bacterium]